MTFKQVSQHSLVRWVVIPAIAGAAGLWGRSILGSELDFRAALHSTIEATRENSLQIKGLDGRLSETNAELRDMHKDQVQSARDQAEFYRHMYDLWGETAAARKSADKVKSLDLKLSKEKER